MIRKVIINNFLLIEEADLDFNPGFTVFTGESGSGKSLVFRAIRFCFGARVDKSYIGCWGTQATVKLIFDTNKTITQFLETNGVLVQKQLVIKHVMSKDKRQCWINDVKVSQSVLKQLAQVVLLDSKQSQEVRLADINIQRGLINQLIPKQDLEEYRLAYEKMLSLQERSIQIEESLDSQDELELLQYQLEEFDQYCISTDHITALQEIVESAKKNEKLIKRWEDEQSSFYNFSQALRRIKQDVENDDLMSMIQEIEDMQSGFELEFRNHIEERANPHEVDSAIKELSVLNDLSRKHRVPLLGLAAFKRQVDDKVRDIHQAQQDSEDVKRQYMNAIDVCQHIAQKLTAVRKDLANSLSESITSRLLLLGMTHAQFQIRWESHELCLYGDSSPRFYIQSNPGQPFKTIDKCLSGGELSRLNLLLASCLQNEQVMLLDEVDAGISGEVGIRIKSLLVEMGKDTQILCISHLAQVASGAMKHYLVHKKTESNQTTSCVKEVLDMDRRAELARIMCGVVDANTVSGVNALLEN